MTTRAAHTTPPAAPGKFEVKRLGALEHSNDGMAVSSGGYSVSNFTGSAFGPSGLGLHIASQTNLSLVFQGGGGHIAVTAEPGATTTLDIETREWDYHVEQFMARVQRRRPWWQRWWQRKQPGTSRPASFTVLNKSQVRTRPGAQAR
jgi:hypothetical protein